MAIPASLLAAAEDHGLGLRNGDDRRTQERRRVDRGTRDRRRRNRRRAQIRTLVMTLATLAWPMQSRMKPHPHVMVSTSAQFQALPPDRAYDSLIQEAARLYRLDAALIRAVMRAESAFNPLIVSRAGAQGLMQLMPSLAAEMGVRDPFDPRENIMAGARYLRQLLDRHHGNIDLTLASYNAGPGTVKRYRNRIPPYKETRQYVKKIRGFLKQDDEDSSQ